MDAKFFQNAKQITKSMVTILSWTFFALLLIIIGFLFYYLIATNIYAKRGEKFEPAVSLYTIVSPSMEPNIKVYDVIINKKVDDYTTIKKGDIITFVSTSNISKGMTVTHRVTSVVNGPNGLEYRTKGDNNLAEDTDTAKSENVLGKVILKIPQLGRLQFFLSNKGGWLLIVILPAMYIIIKDIMKIIKLSKAKKNVNQAETEKIDEEKIKLEAFRKEEIRNRLDEKELEKANKLKNKMKKNNNLKNKEEQIDNLSKNINYYAKDKIKDNNQNYNNKYKNDQSKIKNKKK